MSEITGIYLKNFQAIKAPAFIKLNKLTFLFGPNSAGKSTVIDALDMLNQISSNVEDKETKKALNFFDKYSRKGESKDSSYVGLEYVAPNMKKGRHSSDAHEEWWDNLIRVYETLHQDFFKAITGKKVQFQIGDSGDAISVAIDSVPLFEFKNKSLHFDNALNRYEDSSYNGLKNEEKISEHYLFGELTFYKNSEYFPLFEDVLSSFLKKFSNPKRRAYLRIEGIFRDLLVVDTEETLTLNGINLSIDRHFQSRFVAVDNRLEELCFTARDDFFDDDEDWFDSEDKQNAFYKKNWDRFHPGDNFLSYAEQGNRIFYKFDEISEYLNSVVKGFLFQLNIVLKDYSHVSGGRSILNSNDCFSYPQKETLKLSNHGADFFSEMARYARYLNDPKDQWHFPKPLCQYDFVNTSLLKHLPSLRQYSIASSSYELSKQNSKPNSIFKDTLIYLFVKHNDMGLNFQDVGSGVSYIFPILTSLWASPLSIIEQPELHLHPSAQCEMGDVFIAATKHNAKSIIESHSEHLLLRVLRRIRETTHGYLLSNDYKFRADELSIYYFDPKSDGATAVKEIRVDDYGELLNTWPGGFFSERERELFGERDLRN